ncbi:MAG TPA: sialidase family protein [Ktedonobacterales bacterium]
MAFLARRSGRSYALLALPLALALALAAVLALATPTRAAASSRLLQLSSDPYTNSTSQHRTEVEPDTFAFGSTIVAAVQVGRFFSGGASNIGWATSTNGGHTWTHGFLPGTTVFATPAGLYSRVSDPSVAYDARHGVWLISYLGLFPGGNTAQVDVLASRSTDGGLTWDTPVAVSITGLFNDKNWSVCDDTASSPFYGNCYTEFDVPSHQDLIKMSTSSDGGLTWGPALSTGDNAHGIGGQPVVQPSGTVIVPINGFQSKGGSLLAFSSTDGGASWGKTLTVTKNRFEVPGGNIRAGTLPSTEVDAAGTVYVAWPDCRFETKCGANDIVLSTSSDGVNWTAPVRIPIDPIGSGVDHFLPGLAVDRSTSGASAHLGLVYYYYPVAGCTVATCQLNVGFVSSTDGGATWTASQQIAGPMSLSWLANTNQGVMVGDYMSTSFSGGTAYPALVSANAPSGGVFDEALYTVSGGFSVGGGANAAHADPVLVSADNAPAYAVPLTSQ